MRESGEGENNERRFSWGDEDPNLYALTFPEARLLNYNNITSETAAVGQHADGVGPYGVHNLAGNVMEWVADWYDPSHYTDSPGTDPTGPATGEQRVARGGHFLVSREVVTVTVRNRTQIETRDLIPLRSHPATPLRSTCTQ